MGGRWEEEEEEDEEEEKMKRGMRLYFTLHVLLLFFPMAFPSLFISVPDTCDTTHTTYGLPSVSISMSVPVPVPVLLCVVLCCGMYGERINQGNVHYTSKQGTEG